MRLLSRFPLFVFVSLLFSSVVSCDPIPPLHLHDEQAIDMEFPLVEIDLDVMWNYDLAYEFSIDSIYDWRREWSYGWDLQDSLLFGPIGYTRPTAFDIRRYYLGREPSAPHTQVLRNQIDGNKFRAQYQFGYYDLLVWNVIQSSDGVQSVIFDEETTLDSVVVHTNPTRFASHYHAPNRVSAYNQPDELFSAQSQDFYVSKNAEDYDRYDPVERVYYKYLNMYLYPVTYIYLTQVIIHHNWGKVVGTDGNATLSNMAYTSCLNSGIAGQGSVDVHYETRFKAGTELDSVRYDLDIIGGRLTTFGIRGINPFRYTDPRQLPEEVRQQRHYLDVNFLFGNGYDSTLVFDVTDQVLRRFRGGVITVELNMDTVPIPSRAGGSGFDAVVEDWVEETHEFDFSKN